MNDFITTWIDEINHQTDQLRNLFDSLTLDQLNQKPAADKWSVGEIVEHLIVSNRLYFEDFSSVGRGSYTNIKGIGWKVIPKLLGRMITKSITPVTTKKYRTVSAFKPTHSTHALAILDEFETMQEELVKLVDGLRSSDLDKTYITSPASGMIVYSLRDALTIILNHEKRHIGQIEGLLQREDNRASG